MEPLLSVCLITYNHVKYIEQAIEGVLMQQVNFSWELIIADDCSTDGTTDVLRKYKERYPNKLQLIIQPKNVGPLKNWIDLLASPKGKYIAYFEGDDFWSNENKLQKQVDFLEANPDFAICFHNALIQNEQDYTDIRFSNNSDQKGISIFNDLAQGEYIYTPTSMFRRKDLQKFPTRYFKFMNNYTLDLHNAQFGKIKYINEVMAVYRIHPGGIWSMVARNTTLVNQLPTYKFYINYFDKQYRHFFFKHIQSITKEIITIKLETKDHKDFWKYYFNYVRVHLGVKSEYRKMFAIFNRVITDKIKYSIKRN